MKTFKSIIIAGILLCNPSWLYAYGAPSQPAQFVRILPAVEVDQPLLSLWHLADQQKPMGTEIVEKLSQTTVGAAPELGKSFTIPGEELRRLVNEAKLPQGISILLPDQVVVKRTALTLTKMDLIDIFEEALQQDIAGHELELIIGEVNTGADITLPSGNYTYTAKRLGGKWGKVTVLVDFFVEGRRFIQTRITGTVEVYGRAITAARSLPTGHVLTMDDIAYSRVNLGEAGVAALNDPLLAVGQKLRSPLSMGALLDPRRMQPELLVRPGDIVTMICSNPYINLSTKGKVEQNGYLNSVVKLTNLFSKRQVYGRVVGAGAVVVDF
jgi:flagella basal body P-ring formation protein FlgA